MKITGFQMMDRMEVLREQGQIANKQFLRSLFRFDTEEDKPDPRELMQAFADCERKIALLQTAQAQYNATVQVQAGEETMPLQQAIKMYGSVKLIKQNWQTAAKPDPNEGAKSRYYSESDFTTRASGNEYAQRVVSMEECKTLAVNAANLALALKQAIRSGNAAVLELDIDSSVWE